jgi:predicted RNase H-like HicB family nuclease
MVESDLKKFTVLVREEAEGGYSGQCIELPAAISQGDTLEELKENMVDAISLVLEHMESKIMNEFLRQIRSNIFKHKENLLTVEVPVS